MGGERVCARRRRGILTAMAPRLPEAGPFRASALAFALRLRRLRQ
jgi:hypothetical protein